MLQERKVSLTDRDIKLIYQGLSRLNRTAHVVPQFELQVLINRFEAIVEEINDNVSANS